MVYFFEYPRSWDVHVSTHYTYQDCLAGWLIFGEETSSCIKGVGHPFKVTTSYEIICNEQSLFKFLMSRWLQLPFFPIIISFCVCNMTKWWLGYGILFDVRASEWHGFTRGGEFLMCSFVYTETVSKTWTILIQNEGHSSIKVDLTIPPSMNKKQLIDIPKLQTEAVRILNMLLLFT